ncbi:hypothetical protein ACVIGB_005226 [Bradyrhizobium sp. USDA 4341]
MSKTNTKSNKAIKKVAKAETIGSTEAIRRETFLPCFGGFYCTQWEDMLISTEEIYADMYAADLEGEDGPDVMELRDMLSEFGDVSKHCTALARSWCELYEKKMARSLGFPLGLEFEKLHSPSEYNFTTDRICATMPFDTAKALFEISRNERHKRLIKAIRAWFTPYDGFLPYYSNVIDDWIGKPLASWDKNELCVLLDVFTDRGIDDEIASHIDPSGPYEDSVNWKKFEAMLHRRRKPRRKGPKRPRRRAARRKS